MSAASAAVLGVQLLSSSCSGKLPAGIPAVFPPALLMGVTPAPIVLLFPHCSCPVPTLRMPPVRVIHPLFP